jgi:HTH-type transcriptional regulator / antitoxin HigA
MYRGDFITNRAYEEQQYPILPPDPIEAIKYYMDSRGLDRRDLERYIGSSGRVSEVLNRKRPLTLNMIRKLNAGLGIPAEVLIQSPKT